MIKSQLTSDQWEKIDISYGNLMYKISRNISGDFALCTVNDLVADLQIIAIEATETFKKNTGKSFEDFFDTVEFDKYIKTCLWNYKKSRGSKITKKIKIYTVTHLDDNRNQDIVSDLVDTRSYSFPEKNTEAKDVFYSLSDYQKHLVTVIVKNPELIKKNGKINRLELSALEKKTWATINSEIDSMSKIVGVEL